MSIHSIAVLLVSKLHSYLDPWQSLDRLRDDGWVFLSVFLLEILFLGYGKSSIARFFSKDGKSARVDLLTWLFSYAGVNALLGVAMTFGVISLLTRLVQHFFTVDWAWLTSAHPLLVVAFGIASVILSDLFYYGYHRMLHRPIFWPIHRYHHSAEEFCTLTSLRDHPLEDAFGNLISAIPFIVLGAPVGFVLWLPIGHRLITALHHSKFTSDWGWVGRWLFVSPRMHQLHHSLDTRHYNSNYGSLMTLWDRLFGTWNDDRDSVIQMGLPPGEANSHSWLVGNITSYRDFLRQLVLVLHPRSRHAASAADPVSPGGGQRR